MGSESRMRSFVTSALHELDAHPVENPVFPGTPDVEFIGGWCELKWADLPAGEDTPVRVHRYTKEQKAWARIRMHHGGLCLLLVRVGTYWILLDGDVAAKILGEEPVDTLLAYSWWYSTSKPKPDKLLSAFKSRITAHARTRPKTP